MDAAPTARVIEGDCRATMAKARPESIDAIVTDPPYELGFMGKGWDASGIAYDVDVWREALRVLKPGGHLLAFGGTRTYHRMACAIEDAGFDIRDCIVWLYGSGFPKSLDVSKAIDREAGAEREIVGTKRGTRGADGTGHERDTPAGQVGVKQVGTDVDVTAPATEAAARWEGWGTALKPANEPIVVARKPLVGTVAANVQEHGTGGLNIDGCRVESDDEIHVPQSDPTNRRGAVGSDLGISNADVADFQAAQRESVDRANEMGRWPANLILGHAEACVDGACAAGCPVPELDAQSGESSTPSTVTRGRGQGDYRFLASVGPQAAVPCYGDTGGASRFFYCAKANSAERSAGLAHLDAQAVHRYGAGIGEGDDPDAPALDKNFHPTVKPIALMRWLCRLVTPPGGTVLDPFNGSGTTGCAAVLEGFNYIGLELEPQYAEIARARIAFWREHPEGLPLDAATKAERVRVEIAEAGQEAMF